MDFCRKNRGKVNVLVVADLSRLARNVLDQGTTIATLKQLGIELVSVDEPITDDTAAGKLARNMLGAMNQFFSDSLSERTRYRMQAAVKSGRFPWPAPIGYLNIEKQLVVDHERASLVRKAFELMASGSYPTGDAVLRMITGMGLATRKDRPLSKQSFSRMLQNEIYAGWVVSGDIRVRGKHEPLIADELFQSVQERLNGKSSPHKQLSEDFPLRGIVKCGRCERNLTAGWAKGRTERYARYWCWTKDCKAIGISRDDLEQKFVALLGMLEPVAELIARLPEIAAREWETRKTRIATDAKMLSSKLADQTTLNQKLIRAKLNGEISQEDFDTMKASIKAETERIQEQISALDSERSTVQDLMQQAQMQMIDLPNTWKNGNVNQRQELAKGFFPEGLFLSPESLFFEPRKSSLTDLYSWLLEAQPSGKPLDSYVGVPDGI